MGGIPELIADRKMGMLCKEGKMRVFANAIKDLWENNAKQEEMTRNCLSVGLDTIDEYYNKLINLYTE